MDDAPLMVKALVLATAFFFAVVQLLVHRELVRLLARDPRSLQAVGIEEINWWYRCVRGLFVLAFSEAGDGLPAGSRRLFRVYWFAHGLLAALLVVGFAVWGGK